VQPLNTEHSQEITMKKLAIALAVVLLVVGALVTAVFAGDRGATHEREREVLELIAQGYNNTEIARRLVLSSKTIRNHISNIFSKLQVADRAQAIVRAREAGLG